jgi:UDP-N-acetylglucosamine--N-acetylmuramyl-(pentapeptide) pyrophosphoryl-undecaprenol N-acetylglucosamine transferase
MKVCVAAGGTGGHLFPGLAAAEELRRRGHRVHLVLKRDAASQELVAREGFPSSAFAFAGLPRRPTPGALVYPLRFLFALASARRVLRRERPDVVLGMGGYVSVPVGLAARSLGIPLVVHEQNAHAGLANRLLARWARAVAITFPETGGLPSGARTMWTGLPLRQGLERKDPAACRRALGLDPGAPTLLVFGGSQGARGLNRLLRECLPSWRKWGVEWQVVHLTGPAEAEATATAYRDAGVRGFVRPFWADMATAYGAADFAVTRAGANTVLELAFFGLRALLVPYPGATDDHQARNARWLEASGQAVMEREKGLTAGRILSILRELPAVEELRAEKARRGAEAEGRLSGAAGRLASAVEGLRPSRAAG